MRVRCGRGRWAVLRLVQLYGLIRNTSGMTALSPAEMRAALLAPLLSGTSSLASSRNCLSFVCDLLMLLPCDRFFTSIARMYGRWPKVPVGSDRFTPGQGGRPSQALAVVTGRYCRALGVRGAARTLEYLMSLLCCFACICMRILTLISSMHACTRLLLFGS